MDTLYLKLPQKKNVITDKLVLGDVADIICVNQNIESKVKAISLKRFSSNKKQRLVLSVNDLIVRINEIAPNTLVVPIGETDVVVEYIPKPPAKYLEILFLVIVSVISFVGAAFTMMTFNNDVAATELFSQIYEKFTGTTSSGFTIVELFYSIGLPIGILVFFNHINGHKLTTDPTPLEVEIKQYEYNVNKSLIAENSRKEHLADAYNSFSGSGRSR